MLQINNGEESALEIPVVLEVPKSVLKKHYSHFLRSLLHGMVSQLVYF